MKQTSSAITFLMAQYRAIFKHAYIKGLATAVLLTAGLAAGAAQAETLPTGFADNLENAGNAVISGNVTISDNAFAQSVTIDTGNSLTVSGPNTSVQVKDKVEVNGGTLTVSGNSTQFNSTDAWDDEKSDMDLVVNAGAVKITNGQMVVDDVTLKSGTTVISGSYGGGQANTGVLDNHSYIYAAGIHGIATVTGDANLTIGTDAHFAGRKVIIEGGTVTLSGDQNTTKDGASIIDQNALIVGGSIDLKGGTIKVDAQKSGRISSNNISLAGTNIINSGSLTLSGREDNSVAQAPDYEWSQTTISMAGGSIANTGTLYLGVNTADTFTATGGTVTNTGILNINADADFGNTLNNDGVINISGDTTTAVGNADQLGVYGEGAQGKVTVNKGATLVFADSINLGENVFQDHQSDTAPYLKNEGKIVVDGDLTIEQDSITDADKHNVIAFESGDASLTVNNLFVDQNEYKDGDVTKTSQFVVQTGTLNVLGNVTGEDGYFAVRGETHGDAIVNLGTEGVSSSLTNIARVVVGDGDDKHSTLNVIGDYDFGGAGLVVSSSGTATIYGSIDNSERLQVKSGGTLTVNGSATFDRLLAGSGTEGKVNISGTLTIEGDSSDDTVDVKLSGSGFTVNNGGNFVISANASDDVVNASGSVITENWSGSKVTINAGGKLTVDLSGNTFSSTVLSTLKSSLASTNSGTISFGSVTLSDSSDFIETDDTTNETSVDYDAIVSGGLAGTEIDAFKNETASVSSGNAANVTGTFGAINADAGSTTVGVSSGTLTLGNAADNGGNFATVAGEIHDLTVGANAILTLENGGDGANVGNSNAQGTVNFNANDGVQNFDAIKVATANINTGTVNATAVDVSELNVDGILNVSGGAGTVAIGASGADIAGSLYAGAVTSSGDIDVSGLLTAASITLNGTAGANKLSIGNDEDSGLGEVNSLNLNGGNLIIDPSYDTNASIFAIKGLTTEGEPGADINISGSTLIGQNSILGIGVDLATLTSKMSSYLTNGALDKDNIGAVLYLNTSYEVAAGKNIYIDSTKTGADIEDALSQLPNSGTNTFTLGKNSALVISSELTDSLEGTNNYAINFLQHTGQGGGTITAANKFTFGEGSKIIFESGFVANDTVNLIAQSGSGIDLTGSNGSVTIEAAGGLVDGELSTDGQITFTYNRDKGEQLLTNVSSPVKELMHGIFGDKVENNGAGYDYILDTGTGAYGGGKSVEGTARLAVYGGAIQATLMAQQSSADAVADRLGMANPNSALISSSNVQGGGLWLVPVYKNHDSDGFDAQGVDYGADIDLYGVALGADFTTASGVRAGAYFNLGSGDAEGQGVGSEVSNDFDYFGLGFYAGMTFGNFSLVADTGFTQVSNDLEQNAYLGKLTADTDTQSVSVGVRGEYLFATPWVDVVPHVGMRYTNLDMDSYDAVLDGYTVATTDADNMQVFSIPFGVTFSKDIALGDWSVKPIFDITLTANAGDTEMDADTTFIGAGNLALSTEVMDDFTYGTSLGIDAKYQEAFSFGLNVGYTGSSNADEFGVNANARYTF